MKKFAGAVVAAGVVGGVATIPVGDTVMFRGLVDTVQIDNNQGSPLMEWAGYKYLPMTTLDRVEYANEIPWERTEKPTGVWVPTPMFTSLVLPKKTTQNPPQTTDAIFTTGVSCAGILAPLNDYSNLELRTFRKQ
eukprot:TRINITY_DN48748_c0_g1_i1.p1 TRINITY_DN48748_c0_g1~~TRINITY_DN48748_c0_g1_i1.p1  ORF type:complete len:144 (+),score=29.85 TRINITY_DN48748_c0_g1_i1:30-434(+)